MKNYIGETFFIGKQEYIVNRVEDIDPELKNMINRMKETGKITAQFFASKVLKSGKESKQGGLFYRFEKTGSYIKVL